MDAEQVHGQISEIRYQTWLSKTGRKKSTVAPKLKCLPPTSEAFEENVKHAICRYAFGKRLFIQNNDDNFEEATDENSFD